MYTEEEVAMLLGLLLQDINQGKKLTQLDLIDWFENNKK